MHSYHQNGDCVSESAQELRYRSRVVHPDLFEGKVKEEWLDPAFCKANQVSINMLIDSLFSCSFWQIIVSESVCTSCISQTFTKHLDKSDASFWWLFWCSKKVAWLVPWRPKWCQCLVCRSGIFERQWKTTHQAPGGRSSTRKWMEWHSELQWIVVGMTCRKCSASRTIVLHWSSSGSIFQ